MTEAAMSVVGPDARDAYIRARAQHRFLPVFKTKKEILFTFLSQQTYIMLFYIQIVV